MTATSLAGRRALDELCNCHGEYEAERWPSNSSPTESCAAPPPGDWPSAFSYPRPDRVNADGMR
jgi:hypothetical protein